MTPRSAFRVVAKSNVCGTRLDLSAPIWASRLFVDPLNLQLASKFAELDFDLGVPVSH